MTVGGENDSSLTTNFIHDLGDRQGVAEAVVFRLESTSLYNINEFLELAEVLIRIARNSDILLLRAAGAAGSGCSMRDELNLASDVYLVERQYSSLARNLGTKP